MAMTAIPRNPVFLEQFQFTLARHWSHLEAATALSDCDVNEI